MWVSDQAATGRSNTRQTDEMVLASVTLCDTLCGQTVHSTQAGRSSPHTCTTHATQRQSQLPSQLAGRANNHTAGRTPQMKAVAQPPRSQIKQDLSTLVRMCVHVQHIKHPTAAHPAHDSSLDTTPISRLRSITSVPEAPLCSMLLQGRGPHPPTLDTNPFSKSANPNQPACLYTHLDRALHEPSHTLTQTSLYKEPETPPTMGAIRGPLTPWHMPHECPVQGQEQGVCGRV